MNVKWLFPCGLIDIACVQVTITAQQTHLHTSLYKRDHNIQEPFHFESNYMPELHIMLHSKMCEISQIYKIKPVSHHPEKIHCAHTKANVFLLPFLFIGSKLYDMIASRPELTPKLKQKSIRVNGDIIFCGWTISFVVNVTTI